MNRTPILILILVFPLLLINPRRAIAGDDCDRFCSDVWDWGSVPCTGKNCSGQYEDESCASGCVCGTCQRQGGSGLCCDTKYSVPVIDPGSGSCSGIECGDIAKHARTHAARQTIRSPFSAALRRDNSPGLIMLTATASCRPAVFGYAYNRCKHTYVLVFEEEQAGKRGGM